MLKGLGSDVNETIPKTLHGRKQEHNHPEAQWYLGTQGSAGDDPVM